MTAGRAPGATGPAEFVPLRFWDWLIVIARDSAIPDRVARWVPLLVRAQDGLSGTRVRIPAAGMADRLGLSQRTVERWSSRLVEAGYLVQTARPAPSRAAEFMLFGPAPATATAKRKDGGRTPANHERRSGGRRTSDTVPRQRGERGGRTSATAERGGDPPKHLESNSSSSLQVRHDRAREVADADAQEIDRAAAAICAARPAWSRAGVRAELARLVDAGEDLARALAAGLAAAADQNARTPAAISWEQYHRPATSPPQPICTTCGRAETACRAAAAKTGDPHEFRPGGGS